jgi:hypothetical protein
VVERLFALAGSLNGDAEVVLQLLLADELSQAPGPKRRVQGLVFVLDVRGDDTFFSGRDIAPVSNARSVSIIVLGLAMAGLCASGAEMCIDPLTRATEPHTLSR